MVDTSTVQLSGMSVAGEETERGSGGGAGRLVLLPSPRSCSCVPAQCTSTYTAVLEIHHPAATPASECASPPPSRHRSLSLVRPSLALTRTKVDETDSRLKKQLVWACLPQPGPQRPLLDTSTSSSSSRSTLDRTLPPARLVRQAA